MITHGLQQTLTGRTTIVDEPLVQARSLERSRVMLSTTGLNAAEEHTLLFIHNGLHTNSVKSLPAVERFQIHYTI